MVLPSVEQNTMLLWNEDGAPSVTNLQCVPRVLKMHAKQTAAWWSVCK